MQTGQVPSFNVLYGAGSWIYVGPYYSEVFQLQHRMGANVRNPEYQDPYTD